jgi:16S rRNA (adenine1518-N6/adenine1519-N6)-dimethyltransferase
MLARADTEAYGLLTVVAKSFWEIEKLFEISSKDFYPPPQVASQVLVFRRKPVSLNRDFVDFVKMAFAQRRKFLVKNLSARYSQADTKAGLAKLDIDEKVRAEVLTPEEFQELYKLLK